MNSVVLIGRLTRDPELAFVPATGLAVVKMTLAVDKELFGEKKQQAINQGKPTADFINITVFGKQAENCANYLSKGNKCAVLGRISTGSYTDKNGEKRFTTEVVADRVEFLESKADRQAKPQDQDLYAHEVFEATDYNPFEDEDIPF
ncbi:single-stranded DNA-binding protein [Sedimentibacter hydroxybenzoicus DSM 7310]|uniref:Single-stranded DNA-binding protein n=1 Tax=Sedimentibacter hydroxybenzoicus DSM 7310 TaxID=1123245 RepID=A0A974BJ73_SEDHY|nr:single-stranded DNA-binding protein [Sedimentibacter hydroxybenzoicus]NYB73876.1 single-stranded DNA-binding protein [Sedimentibacter hydroxybenzoicus DSM 7310]